MSEKLCRWGIMGSAGIARKNWQAILNSGNGTLVAVASRSEQRAAQFINECQRQASYETVPLAIGGYDEILQRDDIDAVYIPLPTGLRKEWVIKAANAGKHVMCEKPCAPSLADLQEMIAACDENNVQFMDGVMYMHSGRLETMRHILNDGESVGQIKRIHSHFTFCAPDEFLKENIRVSSELEPHGCLGDLGWYTIRFTLWAMNYKLPHTVIGRQLAQHSRDDSPFPVPMEFSGEMLFDGGVSAGMYNSFLTQNQQLATVSGDKGYLHLTDFVLPFYGCSSKFHVTRSQFNVHGTQANMEEHCRTRSVFEYSNNAPGSQETNLFAKFAALVLGGTRDQQWPEMSLKTQRVLEAMLTSARNGSQPVEI